MKCFVSFLMAAFLLVVACGKDKPTQTQPVDQGILILNKLIISLVPGGSESITVCSKDPNNAYSECTVSNSAPGVASVAISDSTMQVTGISVGTADLTITNEAGKSCTLPVEVYDKNILDAGEFWIAYVDTFTFIWGGPHNFDPVPPNGFHKLGSWCGFDPLYPNGNVVAITVKAKPGSDAIAFTDSFTTSGPYHGSLWRPVAPPGYRALGYVATSGHDIRPDSLACIREDLTVAADVSNSIFIDNSTTPPYSLWKIEQPEAGPHSGTFLVPGNFIYKDYTSPPTNDPLGYILKVNIPTLPQAVDQNFAPQLTGFGPPPMETSPAMQRALLVPFSVITDMVNDIAWQMANSQTYKVERQVFYKCLYHNYNQSDVLQTNSFERVVGISSTETETFRATAGISISAELGVSFSPAVTGKISSTVSFELGYERLIGITEFEERHSVTSLNIPPHKAGAIWQRYNRFILSRHNGNAMEVVGVQEVGIESYAIDVYPD